MKVPDENEWWNKIEQMKIRGEQEMLIKRNNSTSIPGQINKHYLIWLIR